ncbi:hypothetical protein K435DRAFT_711730 [Dendrothele bispora CBS 962.96]|uniref:MI domain-containing protein n=1 Tax=Dendrothele bispora (strain CBS 962.96) TaxID=1314807 RepID=A0A4S8MT16_DENBC|nr:hypothetical protein K435DRAFT_711730 [Dendrothele bispora CBS 962.96]
MSKPSAATSKPSTPLSAKSAWSKGPPQNASASPRSQSPAPSNTPAPTHSRRPSTLGQGIPIKDGVSVRGANVGATKTGSVVSFGSIDDASSAPISASPAAAPANTVKPSESVKTFGTVPATVNGKASVPSSTRPPSSITPSASTSSTASVSKATPSPSPSTSTPPPLKPKVDIKRLFQQKPSSAPPSHPPSDSPSVVGAGDSSSSIAPQPSAPPPTSSQMGSQPFPPYGGPNMSRPPQQNPPSNAGPGPGPGPPRSPYPRQMNGNNVRPANGTSGPPGQAHPSPAMGSPRLGPPPHGQPPNMQPNMPPVQWPGYYYMHDPNYMYAPWSYMPSPPHMPPHHPPGTPHSGMPHSPRIPPPQLQAAPNTPTPVHAQPVPHTPHLPHPPPLSHSSSTNINSVSSPPPTPSSASLPPSSARMNSNASPFIPNRSSKITFKNPDGSETNLDSLKKQQQSHHSSSSLSSSPVPSGLGSASPRRTPIKIESPEEKKKREEKEKEEARAKAEKERLEKEAAVKKKEAEEKARKEKEEAERKAKQEVERKAKEKAEAERKAREEKAEAERKAKEEDARKRKEKEEAERKAKEEEERLRKEKEEAERKAKEEEERKEKEAAERRKHEEEKEKAEKERIQKEKEEAEAASKKAAAEKETKVANDSLEEGEIVESKEESKDVPAGLKDKTESKAEDKKPLRIDTESHVRRRPGPLDLSTAKNVPAALPSALATARNIDDLGRVPYPEGVKSPSVELNVNAKDGKFRYDRDFLLQFMSICKEKPDMLPPLDAIGLEPADQSSFSMGRGGSGPGMRRQASGAGKGVGLGFPGSGFGKAGPPNPFMGGMGNFTTPPKTSEERFQLANGGRPISVSSSMQFTPNRPGQLTRSASHGGPGMENRRTRSKRGDKRDGGKAAMAQSQTYASNIGPGGVPLEPVVPLQATANRWDRKTLGNVDPESAEVVDRKVKGLLNKLTMERFDSISDQIIDWANKSEKEKDGRTLIQVIRLVFEKATDEATWSEMYARLCRKMMEQISPKVQDDGIKNPEGKPIAGGQLFRKYLLNRCQEDFERGWVAKEATAAAAATKAMEDQAAKAANEKKTEGDEEVALYSEEYYAAQKAKRQGLGLIKFIGELFKLQMLTERIMHECVKKLLGNVENPEEEEIESLCKLLTTVGHSLDTNKARAHMDVYFSRMKELTKSPNVGSRMQFMLQDVIELRERKWIARNAVAAPTTIAKVHEAAAKEKAAIEKESYQRQMTMSRGGSRRGADRSENQPVNADGWAVAGGNAPRAPPKAGDLSNFGKISKGGPMTFGPSSVFAGGKKENKRESISRTNSSANMFQMLQNVEGGAEPAPATKGSRPPSRKPSVDLGSSGAPEAPPQRKKLVLAPRSKPLDQDTAPSRQESENGSDAEVSEEPEQDMSEEEAKRKIKEDVKEFFGVRSLDEAEEYFSSLPSAHHHRLVDKFVSEGMERKEADAELVAKFFERAVSKKLCSSTALEDGFAGTVEFLDDIVIDVPKAPNLLAIMMKGASFDQEQRTRLASKAAENGDKLLDLLS